MVKIIEFDQPALPPVPTSVDLVDRWPFFRQEKISTTIMVLMPLVFPLVFGAPWLVVAIGPVIGMFMTTVAFRRKTKSAAHVTLIDGVLLTWSNGQLGRTEVVLADVVDVATKSIGSDRLMVLRSEKSEVRVPERVLRNYGAMRTLVEDVMEATDSVSAKAWELLEDAEDDATDVPHDKTKTDAPDFSESRGEQPEHGGPLDTTGTSKPITE